jgi:hypothetical protein
MPPRTRPRRSSGCTTRRRDHRRALGRPAVAGPELQPAQRVGDPDGCTVVGAERRCRCLLEGLPAVGPGEGRSAVQRRKVAPDAGHIPAEGVGRPRIRVAGRIAQPAQESKGVQRQRPGGRQRWRGSHVARGEEGPGRRREHAEHRHAAGARAVDRGSSRCGLGPGLASGDRHDVMLERPCERRLIARSTVSVDGRRSPPHGPCAGTGDGPGRPRSGCAASGYGHRPCAIHRRSRSPTRAPGAGRG